MINRARAMRFVVVVFVLVCTAGCDQATKQLARRELSNSGSRPLVGGVVEFTLAENPGAFLSLGGSLPEHTRNWLSFGIGCGLIALLFFLLSASRLNTISFLALSFSWESGISNLIDRFGRHGLVTDFIVVRAGPLHTGVFNVADLAIVIGIVVLFCASFAGDKQIKTTGRA